MGIASDVNPSNNAIKNSNNNNKYTDVDIQFLIDHIMLDDFSEKVLP